mmetsp:Transcript_3762/g.9102  ORF Transcript_3762/g.9102 Transcript_3762/m.9102 type:complete len:211 (+) Transcript_3762:985-1617(+)
MLRCLASSRDTTLSCSLRLLTCACIRFTSSALVSLSRRSSLMSLSTLKARIVCTSGSSVASAPSSVCSTSTVPDTPLSRAVRTAVLDFPARSTIRPFAVARTRPVSAACARMARRVKGHCLQSSYLCSHISLAFVSLRVRSSSALASQSFWSLARSVASSRKIFIMLSPLSFSSSASFLSTSAASASLAACTCLVLSSRRSRTLTRNMRN